MRVSTLTLAAGVLYQAQQVQAWWGEDLWNWLTGGSSGPIAMQRMNSSDNFSDRCTPSDECWPSPQEWDDLNTQLNGRLLSDVKPYAEPCYRLGAESPECQERSGNFTTAYYRDDVPGAMMSPIFECDIDEAECCGPI